MNIDQNFACDVPADSDVQPNFYGLAVDIGTTTIAFAIYHEKTRIVFFHELNQQYTCGADVISRIGSGQFREMHRCINEQLRAMMRKSGVAAKDITRAVITGNTTMLHLLMGLDPTGLGAYPFTPESYFGEIYSLDWLPGAQVYLPPCISAFVGADCVCSAIATHLQDDLNTMLVDIGTNGEMILNANGRLLCCSVAAGPAFEGTEISMGMPALSGAIDNVWERNGEIQWHSLPGAEVRGICGSGMLGALRCFLELGMLDCDGLIRQDNVPSLYIGDSNVEITQLDIRKLQLAKASIAAGIDTLLHESGLSIQDIRKIYIAGGFGSYLNSEDAENIGMIPEGLAKKAESAGNCALKGAVELLYSLSMRTVAKQFANATEVSLASNAYFQQRFLECLEFPPRGFFE